ncbi:MAG: VOC family protein [Rhodobacteraceae bacterium]|jgi:catechol 2,3-dioxygenase-like lactoylglutathione lyase family enzyme|nr:VOC family protein [Paracoccaceae bacterium]
MSNRLSPDGVEGEPAGWGAGPFGQLLHASVAVDDLDAASAFLAGALGFRVDFVADDLTDEVARLTTRAGLTVRLAQLSRHGEACRVELIEFRDPGRGGAVPPTPADGPVPLAHLAVAAADLDAGMRRLAAAGAVPLGEVVVFPEGRCIYLRGPGGVVIELEEVGLPDPAGSVVR